MFYKLCEITVNIRKGIMYNALEKLLIVLFLIVGVVSIAAGMEKGQTMNFAYKITGDMNVTTAQIDHIHINEVQEIKVTLS